MRNGLPDAVRRRLDPDARYGLRVTLAALALLLVALPFAALLQQVTAGGPITTADAELAADLNGLSARSPLIVDGARAVTLLGLTVWLLALALAAATWAWRHGRRRAAIFVLATALGGLAVQTTVKAVVGRDRPVLEVVFATASSGSFPSGHAMGSTIVYGALLLVALPAVTNVGRRAGLAVGAATVVAAVGLSRLVLGVHYLTDVVGGWILGLAWLFSSVAAFATWRSEARSEAAEKNLGNRV